MKKKRIVIQTPFPTLEEVRKTMNVSKSKAAWIEGLVDGIHLTKSRPYRSEYLRGVMESIRELAKKYKIKDILSKYKRGLMTPFIFCAPARN